MMDGVAKSPRAEADMLFDVGFPFARKMLEENGAFYPFGVAMKADRTIEYVTIKPGREVTPACDVLESLFISFREAAAVGNYRAVAAFLYVHVRRPDDGATTLAVQICLEHVDGFFADVFIPYRLTEGAVAFEPPFAYERVATVFVEGHKGI